MSSSEKNIICISCDIKLDSTQREILWAVLRNNFPNSEFTEVSLIELNDQEYRAQSKHWNRVVILFGGYNIKTVLQELLEAFDWFQWFLVWFEHRG